MSKAGPFARLPSEIALSLAEAKDVLFALDVADSYAVGHEVPVVDRAIRLVSGKLWPELGDLLEDDDQ